MVRDLARLKRDDISRRGEIGLAKPFLETSMECEGVTIEDAPASFKSFVWQHFGFPVEKMNGNRVTDKSRTICKHCRKIMPYTAANTSTMQKHLQNHHSSLIKSTAPVKTIVKGQTTLTDAFAQKLPQTSARANGITKDICVFIAVDMRPFSVVENVGFRRLLHTLEPKYTIPSRAHFARTVVLNLYKESKANVIQTLKKAESIAITTDGWTSRGMQSYITITAHTLDSDWEMINVVLQTRPLFESHTGANIAEILRAAIIEWDLNRPNNSLAIVTDNARNMDVAAREAGLKPHKVFCTYDKPCYPSWPRYSAGHSFARAGETCGCFFPSQFNSNCVIDVQAKVATITCTQVDHGRYHAMEQHLGYAGSLPGAANRCSSSSHQPRD